MTKSEVIAGLKKLYCRDSGDYKVVQAAITFLEQEQEIQKYKKGDEIWVKAKVDNYRPDTDNVKIDLYSCAGWVEGKNCKLVNEVKPLPPEQKSELPEEIALRIVYPNDTIMLAEKINALIRYLKAKEGR